MKPILISFALFLLASNLFSQMLKYSSYETPLNDNSQEINIYSDKGDFTIYLQAVNLDDYSGSLIIEKKRLEQFRTNILHAKFKFSEWVKVAKENNVTELTKKLDLETAKINASFYYGQEWFFSFGTRLVYTFTVYKNDQDEIEYMMYGKTGEITASTNQYIKSKGFVIAFTEENQFDDLYNKLSIEKINEYLSKPKSDDLFK